MNSKLKTQNLELPVLVIAMLFALSFPAEPQQRGKPLKIGYLVTSSRAAFAARTEAFLKGLSDLGYQEEKNLVLESRYAEGDVERLLPLATELVRIRVDIIVAGDNRAARAARKASAAIPIVMTSGRDPVEAGLVASHTRPGGNVTGLTNLSPELLGKRIDLLKETLPQIARLSVLLDVAPAEGGGTATAVKEMRGPASRSGIVMQSLEVKSPKPDFDQVFRELAKNRAQALIVSSQPTLAPHRKRILELAMRVRVPTMTSGREWVESGALMSYGVVAEDSFRRAASYVDRIAKGAKPADLPVEAPTKLEFVVNLKTAKALNLTIPQAVLYRADKVIK